MLHPGIRSRFVAVTDICSAVDFLFGKSDRLSDRFDTDSYTCRVQHPGSA